MSEKHSYEEEESSWCLSSEFMVKDKQGIVKEKIQLEVQYLSTIESLSLVLRFCIIQDFPDDFSQICLYNRFVC
jgi:hypothetical protein